METKLEQIIIQINELSVISPILVPIAKISLAIIVCLCAFIPASLLSWIVFKAFGGPLNLGCKYLNAVATRSFRMGKQIQASAARKLFRFYANYNSIIPLDAPKLDVSVHPLQQAIDGFEEELSLAPKLAQDREVEKTKLVEKLNASVEELGGGITELEHLDIPELELDKGHAVRKRAARSSLFLFLPLLLAVITVNTVLLNTFFDELLDGREVLDIPYAIVIALMFTLIETGIGVVFAYQEKENAGNRSGASHLVIYVFGWAVIAGLAVVEWFLYLMIGTSSQEFDIAELGDVIASGKMFEIFVQGGWMSLLGPAIVLGLYIFGHRVSTAYFDFMKVSDFERFKKDLDNRFHIFEKMQSGVETVSLTVREVVDEIKEENIRLNDVGSVGASNLDKFKEALKANISKINDAISSAEKTEIPIPKIEVVSLSFEDTVSLHRSNILYLLMAVSSWLVLAIVLPDSSTYLGKEGASSYLNFLVALMLVGLMIFFGLSVSARVNIVQTSDNAVGKIIVENGSPLNLSLGAISLASGLGLLWFIFGGLSAIDKPVPIFLSMLCLASSVVVGKRLLSAISSWWIFLSVLQMKFRSLVMNCIGILFTTVSRVLGVVAPLAEALSYPVRFIFRSV
jgi:hypothetical protein